MSTLGLYWRRSGLGSRTQLPRVLEQLQKEERVRLVNGKWFAVSDTAAVPHLPLQHLSAETAHTLCTAADDAAAPADQGASASAASTFTFVRRHEEPEGPWTLFRRLLGYYRQCLAAEEGVDARVYLADCNKKFLFLGGSLVKLPIVLDAPWHNSIGIAPHMSEFLQALPAGDGEDTLILGYPVESTRMQGDNAPYTLLNPIFYFPVEHHLSGRVLELSIARTRPSVNQSWLNFRFKSRPDLKRNFLTACGYLPSPSSDTAANGDRCQDLQTLVHILESFHNERVRGTLDCSSFSSAPLDDPPRDGIHSKAILMIARRTRYTATLCRELSHIEAMPDDVLDHTALARIFRQPEPPAGPGPDDTPPDGVVPAFLPLNTEQKAAAASLLRDSVSVITGPPGTGKSQVVAAAIAGIRLRKASVLFASRNHKALDAVVPRLTLADGRSLIVRCNAREDATVRFRFTDAIQRALAEKQHPEAWASMKTRMPELESVLARLDHTARETEALWNLSAQANTLEEQRCALWAQAGGKGTPPPMPDFPEHACRTLLDFARGVPADRSPGILTRLLFLLHHVSAVSVRRALQDLDAVRLADGWGASLLMSVVQRQKELSALLALTHHSTELGDKLQQLDNAKPLASLLDDLAAAEAKLVSLTPEVLALDLDVRSGLSPDVSRTDLANLKLALQNRNTGLYDRQSDVVERLLHESVQPVLFCVPCWAVTSLSVGSHLPLLPAMFDLAVVDEASQSDIPSAIPLMFRARRIGVVGDPWQLSHVSSLRSERNALLLHEARIDPRDLRFSYVDTSLYDLAAGCDQASPVMLEETYRSDPHIVAYINQLGYDGRLRTGTDLSRLNIPRGAAGGICWTDVAGTVTRFGSSGCCCQEEVDEIVRLVRVLVLDNSYKGTIGIVTPFRQQAQRLQDALYQQDTLLYQSLEACRCHVDTAHGFQGDERDVMFFSLCAGPDMPGGSLNFLRGSAQIFNVAASRARAVLHVVGNRNWARSCGIRHIELLARGTDGVRRGAPNQGSPWAPHESPWEKTLYDALCVRGLEPRIQFPLGCRRLDLALVDETRKRFIDIEVDGSCHRTDSGARKISDYHRDIEVQGKGWQVMRFWVYQLQEHLDTCVDDIVNAWEEDHGD